MFPRKCRKFIIEFNKKKQILSVKLKSCKKQKDRQLHIRSVIERHTHRQTLLITLFVYNLQNEIKFVKTFILNTHINKCMKNIYVHK